MKSQNKRRAFWFILGLAVGISITIGISKTAADPVDPATLPRVYISEEAPTLWDIAEQHYPEKDPRWVVHEIRKLNPGIEIGRLQVGQILTVPQGGE